MKRLTDRDIAALRYVGQAPDADWDAVARDLLACRRALRRAKRFLDRYDLGSVKWENDRWGVVDIARNALYIGKGKS